MRAIRSSGIAPYSPPQSLGPNMEAALTRELASVASRLNDKPDIHLNDINTVWVEGHALANAAAPTPPTDAIRGNFAVALYADAANSTGYVTTHIRIPGTYTLWLIWAPDTIPANPTTTAVVWTPCVTIISKQIPTGVGTEGVTTNSPAAVTVGAKLPAAADQTVWTPLYDNLKIDDYSVIGISLNRDGAVAGDDCTVDVYVLGLFFERTGG